MEFRILRFGIFILLVPLLFLNIRDNHNWGDDFAQYILQAKNLAEGKPQTEGAYIFNPDYPFYAPPIYPVGYSVLLAPVYYLFGNDLVAFNYFQTLLLFIFGVATFFFLKRYMEPFSALALTLVMAYNPWMIDFKSQMLADLPFSLFMLLSALCYLHFRDKKQWSAAVLAGCLAGFAIVIKPSGLLLVAAMGIDSVISIFKREGFNRKIIWQHLLLLLSPVIFYLLITQALIPSSQETTGHFQSLYDSNEKLNHRFNINADYYMVQFQNLFEHSNPDWNFFAVALRAFVLTLFLLGFFGKLFNRFTFPEIFTVLFLLIVLFFPNTTQGFRYLLPVLPFLLLYVYHGFESIKLGRLNRRAVFVCACLFCIFQYKSSIGNIRRNQHASGGPQERVAQEAFNYISKNTEPHAVIAFIKPRALALYTQRKTLTNHPQQEMASMDKFFTQHNVSYYLMTKDLPNEALEKYLAENRELVQMVWFNEEFILYQRKQ